MIRTTIYDYLIKCCKYHSRECIDLVSVYNKYDRSDAFTGPFYDGSEPVKVLAGAYNSIYEASQIDKKYTEKVLDLFDRMLNQQLFFRNSVNQILDSV